MKRIVTGVHTHRCVRCRKDYDCANACDPVGEGLTNSICVPCFKEVSAPCSP